MELKGIGASSGVAIAKVFELIEVHVDIKKETANPSEQIEKLESAVKKTIKEIEGIKERAAKNLDEEHAALFDAHIQVVSDPMMIDEVKNLIESEKCNALWATSEIFSKYVDLHYVLLLY